MFAGRTSKGAGQACLLVVLTVTACSPSPRTDAVESSARSFMEALAAGDGSAACDLLTEDARDAVSGATEVPCNEAIRSVEPSGHDAVDVQEVAVWADAAQVRLGGDVVFLRHTDRGWRVSAADCRPRPPRPYECRIGG